LRLVSRNPSAGNVGEWREYVVRTWPLDGVEQRILTLACDCWTIYTRCRQVLATEGLTLKPTRRGASPRERPEIRILERARSDFARFVDQLGLASAGDPETFVNDEVNDGQG
jgi:phage terminase small subunit